MFQVREPGTFQVHQLGFQRGFSVTQTSPYHIIFFSMLANVISDDPYKCQLPGALENVFRVEFMLSKSDSGSNVGKNGF